MKSVSSRKAYGKLLKYLPGILSLNQFENIGRNNHANPAVGGFSEEIFQNGLNFSLEKYLSWQKRTDL